MIMSRRHVLALTPALLQGVEKAAANDDRFDSGFPAVDRGVLKVLNFATNVFGLEGSWVPDFSFYDEDGEPNSQAPPPITIAGEPMSRPKILIGRKLVKDILDHTKSGFGTALSGIFAHEFAHVFQMMNGDFDKLLLLDPAGTERLREIHADFLAGWALPQAYWITNVQDLARAADEFYALGDTAVDSKDHHGSSIQRQSVMACGYTWGLTAPGDARGASTRALLVIRDLFPSWISG